MTLFFEEPVFLVRLWEALKDADERTHRHGEDVITRINRYDGSIRNHDLERASDLDCRHYTFSMLRPDSDRGTAELEGIFAGGIGWLRADYEMFPDNWKFGGRA